ncbi:MAG: DUF2333 family protein [Cellvibrionaceae bacterium]|nr:DUF2333 family protein [Cellvibrionaceae bacterium]
MRDSANGNAWFRGVSFLVGLYLVATLLVGMYWSSEPGEDFYLSDESEIRFRGLQNSNMTGVETTVTLIKVADTLLNKPGGFLSNDITPPGVWLDNIPNWEYGALIQVRDLSKAMRESFSRSQSQSTEDADLALAEPRFNFDNNSWMLPASEKQYREGVMFLHQYLNRLVDDDQHDAQFFARADNLRNWLRTVETRLGSLSQRLSASVGQRRINTDLAGEENASQSTPAPREMEVKTPWMEIDDVFYEARGSTWALLQFLRAMEKDFADVLAKKNAGVSLKQIIRELEAAQQPVHSPMIVNGSGFGMLANHSLVMASYISRANAAIIDLRELLSKG